MATNKLVSTEKSKQRIDAIKEQEAKKSEYIPFKARKLSRKIYSERESFEPVV